MNPDLAAEVERDPSWDVIDPLHGRPGVTSIGFSR